GGRSCAMILFPVTTRGGKMMQPALTEITMMRSKIVNTARLFFTTKGVDQTTLEDVMQALHINQEIFRKNFNSMDELLEVVWSER
ncbi:MAG TPA: TetR family transcriptional regulator, partial [Desulfopila sp.]|nr:TetR family transcriptional regulator [Desulfopila sp.]